MSEVFEFDYNESHKKIRVQTVDGMISTSVCQYFLGDVEKPTWDLKRNWKQVTCEDCREHKDIKIRKR